MYKAFLLIFRLKALIFTFVTENSNTNLASSRDKDVKKPTSLPDDIWYEILVRLPAQAIVKCRDVCNNWNELTRTDHFIDLQHRRTKKDPPCLIVQSEINRNSLLLLDCNGFKTIDLQVDRRLRRSKIRCVCNGMICMEVIWKRSCLLFVINPLTSEYVQLPSLPDCPSSNTHPVFGFGFDKSSGKHKVVRVCEKKDDFGQFNENGRYISCPRFEIFTLGESSWRHLSSSQAIPWPFGYRSIEWNGFIFWLGMSGRHEYPLIAFDLCNEECTISYLSAPWLGGYCNLVVLGESLAVVKVRSFHFDLKIKVWKISGNKVEGFHLLNEIVYDMTVQYTCPRSRSDLYKILVMVYISNNGGDTLLDFLEDEKRFVCDFGVGNNYRWLEPFQFRSNLISPVDGNYNSSS